MFTSAPALLIAFCFLLPSLAPCGDREAGEVRGIELFADVPIELVWVPPGRFTMGSPLDEEGRSGSFLTEAQRREYELPEFDTESQREVELDPGFWIGATEVTQAQWHAVMGENPSRSKGDLLPVESVSWEDIQRFLERVNRGRTRGAFRLPWEAEWEYACRAGTTGPYAGKRDELAWCRPGAGNRSHPVATKEPNALGLFDMHGNVSEWCQDWFGAYPIGPLKNPRGVSTEESRSPANGRMVGRRVVRGGSYTGRALHCRSADRGALRPEDAEFYIGFRLVWTAFADDEAPQ